MDCREQIVDAIYAAIRAANATLKPAQQVACSPDTPLLGGGAAIESVVVVGILAGAEENLEQIFGTPVEILDVVAEAGEVADFTVADLARWVETRLRARENAPERAPSAPLA